MSKFALIFKKELIERIKTGQNKLSKQKKSATREIEGMNNLRTTDQMEEIETGSEIVLIHSRISRNGSSDEQFESLLGLLRVDPIDGCLTQRISEKRKNRIYFLKIKGALNENIIKTNFSFSGIRVLNFYKLTEEEIDNIIKREGKYYFISTNGTKSKFIITRYLIIDL